MKAGVSEYGASAISSHTGSLAPESSVFAAACKQAGAIVVSSLREFYNISKLLSLGVGFGAPIQRLVVLTNGGGPSVVAADEIGLSNSLSLVQFDENIKNELRKILPPMAAVGNPIDMIGDAPAERYGKVLDILCGLENVQGVIVMLTPQMMIDVEETARVLGKYKEKKKIFPAFLGGVSIEKGRNALLESGLTNFGFSKDIVDGLDALAKNAKKIESKKTPSPNTPIVLQAKFTDMTKILSGYGMHIEGKFITDKGDLEDALGECGSGPYAMKAISTSIVHKTDAGAVRLNILNFKEAVSVWEEMVAKFSQIEGMLVQKMEKGREIIIGIKRDKTFGPTILFGLGGILAEAMKDTAVRIAPVSKEEALEMMHEIKGTKILEGMRGEKPINFDALAEIIANLSRLALEHPEIKEIDLNPVICSENSATIVDARMIM